MTLAASDRPQTAFAGEPAAEPLTRGNETPETCGAETAYLCPRCGRSTAGTFYAPCEPCRIELRGWRAEPVEQLPADDDDGRTLPGVTVSGVVAARRYWSHKRRPLAFVPTGGGVGVDSSGQQLRVGGELVELLDGLAGYRMVYLCGADAGRVVRAMFGAEPEGWQRVALHEHDRHPSVTFSRGDQSVRFAAVGVWTGDDATDPAAVCEAWRWMADNVAPTGGQLLATPSSTGRDWMARLLPRDIELPTLTDELCEQIRASSTQHRMELLGGGRDVPGMVELDMRLAFAAVLRQLPVGVPVRMTGEPSVYDPYRAGRYFGKWEVPADWSGPGLLPSTTGDGWTWISRPGSTASGWVDGAELALARRQGWRVTVTESMVWPERALCDPLRQWAELLGGWYVKLDRGAVTGLSDRAAAVARRMVRATIIHAIGSLRGKPQQVTRTCPEHLAAELVPAGSDWWVTADGTVTWTEHTEPAWAEWVRPEWTAAVWARTRCRLLESPGAKVAGRVTPKVGALHLPVGVELLGFRGDALYLTDDPRWPDDGAIGRFRVKVEHGPLSVPESLHELDEVRRNYSAAPAAESISSARAALRRG